LRDRFCQGKTWYLRDLSDPPLFPGKLPSLLSLFFWVNYLQHIALTMSSHSCHSNESEGKSIKYLLKKIAQDVQALSYRELQHETQLKERDAQFALVQDEWKMVKERDDYTKSKKSSHASSSRVNDSFGEQNLRTNDYYQTPP